MTANNSNVDSLSIRSSCFLSFSFFFNPSSSASLSSSPPSKACSVVSNFHPFLLLPIVCKLTAIINMEVKLFVIVNN